MAAAEGSSEAFSPPAHVNALSMARGQDLLCRTKSLHAGCALPRRGPSEVLVARLRAENIEVTD
jgi:hypothetical protein